MARVKFITTMAMAMVVLFMFASDASYGGIRDVPNFQNNADIERLAHFAVDEFNKQENGNLSFSKVVRAQEQVVAGMMYYLIIEAMNGVQAGLYDAKILVVLWRNVTQLKEFKPSQSLLKDKTEASGWHTVSTNDHLVQEAAHGALKFLQQRSNSMTPYELQKILSAKEQEVNGLKNFNLLLKIKWGNKMEQYKVEMKRSVDGKWTMKY
ncbi:hypothetical protein SUGI_0601960 [Cryptomeria japonica]|uniref:cysteine proteinase inhibitor 6 n=1 Tax=Cryptomeria japonica TaxID=3369 RepID=UPI0024149E06|nr:cysteine proteinase inhibitor 6 [Cryptomeria japonica]GLJ30417.1 hypothetical protein SUGI_0601960 [Cryptomeria japonica]